MAQFHRKRFSSPGSGSSSVSLASAVAGPQSPTRVVAARTSRQLWLCLYFHDLPLEAAAAPDTAACAVLNGEGRRPHLLLCNSAAEAAGVRPGMSVNAALALEPGLQVVRRDVQRERAILTRLAAWAIRFTPIVSLDPANALLLEVGASLKLFGGLAGLRAAVSDGVRSRGYAVRMAFAPTRRAALWLARAGGDIAITDSRYLPGALAKLPLDCLDWPAKTQETLRRMGVRCLGDSLRLPRDGLARRIGARWLRELDEALGRQPEARESYSPTGHFRDLLELPAEAHSSLQVLAALQVLLARLYRHLQVQQAGVQTLWIRLAHRGMTDTWLRVGLLRPVADIRHLRRLAELQLSASRLAAPVVAVGLRADTAAFRPTDGDLFAEGRNQPEALAQLLESLRARLGFQAVHGVGTVPGHRPERAWHVVTEPGSWPPPNTSGRLPWQRPLWLLEQPALLDSCGGQPRCGGTLTPADGPERIESGWWDGQDIRRDYYVMHNPHGVRLWVFRDRRDGAWYLHGIFG